MKNLFRMLFIWWQGATVGTWLTTWCSGKLVGSDHLGNRYYQTADRKRRWVIFSGTVEASLVPPDWHGWLHHTFDQPPTIEPFKAPRFELEHEPNLTGTSYARRPSGSLWAQAQRPPATGDYKPWTPN